MAFGRLPVDLRLRADAAMRAFVLTEVATRDLASRIRHAEESNAAVSAPELAAWTQALRTVKAQHDAANSQLNTLVDACLALSVEDETRAMFQGLFAPFVEAVGEANREMQEVISRAATRRPTARG